MLYKIVWQYKKSDKQQAPVFQHSVIVLSDECIHAINYQISEDLGYSTGDFANSWYDTQQSAEAGRMHAYEYPMPTSHHVSTWYFA